MIAGNEGEPKMEPISSPAISVLQQRLGLTIDPFASGALPDFFFVGGQRRFLAQRAVHALYFASGIVLLSGARGAGKSRVLDEIVVDLRDLTDTCRIEANVMMDGTEIRRLVAASLGMTAQVTLGNAALIAALAQWRPAGHEPQPITVLIDDAHLLATTVLAECAVLALSAGGRLRLLLAGEPNLLAAWSQAGTTGAEHIELLPLDRQETADYVLTRLQAAGYRAPSPLSDSQWRELFQRTAGNFNAIHEYLPILLAPTKSARTPSFAALLAMLKEVPLRHLAIAGGLLIVVVALLLFKGGADNAPSETASANVSPKSNEQRSVALTLPTATRSPVASAPVAATAETSPAPEPSTTSTKSVAIPAPTKSPAPSVASQPAANSSQTVVAPQPVAQPINKAQAPVNSIEKPTEKVAEIKSTAKIAESKTPAAEPTVVAAAPAKSSTDHAGQNFTADERELLSWPKDQYVLQLLGAESTATVQKFIRGQPPGLNLYMYRTRLKGRSWNIVVTGPYSDRNSATVAAKILPPALSDLKPWPRTLTSIQKDIHARDEH